MAKLSSSSPFPFSFRTGSGSPAINTEPPYLTHYYLSERAVLAALLSGFSSGEERQSSLGSGSLQPLGPRSGALRSIRAPWSSNHGPRGSSTAGSARDADSAPCWRKPQPWNYEVRSAFRVGLRPWASTLSTTRLAHVSQNFNRSWGFPFCALFTAKSV